MEQWWNLHRSKFPVQRRNRQQFTSGKFFGRATLIDIDVGRLCAHDGVVRPGRCLQPKDVSPGTSENKKDLRVLAEMFLKLLNCARGEWIIAVGNHVTIVGCCDGVHYVRMNARVIVTSKTSAGLVLSQVVVWSLPFLLLFRSGAFPFRAIRSALDRFECVQPAKAVVNAVTVFISLAFAVDLFRSPTQNAAYLFPGQRWIDGKHQRTDSGRQRS